MSACIIQCIPVPVCTACLAAVAHSEAPFVVAFMKAIEAPVKAAIAASGTPRQFELEPFPGNGRQGEFRSAMTAIMPKLLNR